jgi:glycosyltransferase involved in cell wall biosynthesis
MIEVIGDPEEAIASVGGGLLVKLIAGISKLLMKHVVAEANVVSYVNSSTLPDKYPPLKAIAWDSISSIRLDRKYLATRREYKEPLKDIRLLYVGTLTERKRVRDLVSAVGILKARKVSITLTIVGDGPLRQALQDQSRRLGLESDCHFIGQLPGLESILPHIDESDLFVMPSASEGLPRAVIEAMARGTPVVGTRVQGTSELVPREDTYPVEEVETLAKLIQDVTSNPARLNSMSTYSIETATKYIDDILSAKRRRLYQNLRELGTLQ